MKFEVAQSCSKYIIFFFFLLLVKTYFWCYVQRRISAQWTTDVFLSKVYVSQSFFRVVAATRGRVFVASAFGVFWKERIGSVGGSWYNYHDRPILYNEGVSSRSQLIVIVNIVLAFPRIIALNSTSFWAIFSPSHSLITRYLPFI